MNLKLTLSLQEILLGVPLRVTFSVVVHRFDLQWIGLRFPRYGKAEKRSGHAEGVQCTSIEKEVMGTGPYMMNEDYGGKWVAEQYVLMQYYPNYF